MDRYTNPDEVVYYCSPCDHEIRVSRLERRVTRLPTGAALEVGVWDVGVNGPEIIDVYEQDGGVAVVILDRSRVFDTGGQAGADVTMIEWE